MEDNNAWLIVRDGIPVGFFASESDAKLAMRLCNNGFVVEREKFKRCE